MSITGTCRFVTEIRVNAGFAASPCAFPFHLRRELAELENLHIVHARPEDLLSAHEVLHECSLLAAQRDVVCESQDCCSLGCTTAGPIGHTVAPTQVVHVEGLDI